MSIRAVTSDVIYVGASDRRISLFENLFPLENGVSYNSYVILDDKTALIDTADQSVSGVFFDNVAKALDGRKLDYIVVNHMEPDHASTLERALLLYPEALVVATARAKGMFSKFFNLDIDSRFIAVKEGDKLSLGKHNLQFFMAPMVHWPEVMVTYDALDKILFSADAFGAFGALNALFNDEIDIEKNYLPDARRYYFNIVGKYGNQVMALLNKASALDIKYICPLHGVVWRNNIGYIVEKYQTWGSYKSEEQGVVIVYGSVHGNTANAANILANRLRMEGVKSVAVYDASKTDVSYLLSECFKFSHVVFAAATYNGGIFSKIETLLLDLKAHLYQNKTVGIMENGSWAPTAAKLMKEMLVSMKNLTILDTIVTINSAVKCEEITQIEELVKDIVRSLDNVECES